MGVCVGGYGCVRRGLWVCAYRLTPFGSSTVSVCVCVHLLMPCNN